MCLNHPETSPPPSTPTDQVHGKTVFHGSRSLVAKRLGTAGLGHVYLETSVSTNRQFRAYTLEIWKQFIIISFSNNINLKLNNLSKDRQMGGGRANGNACHLNWPAHSIGFCSKHTGLQL